MPVSKTDFMAKVAEILATDPQTLSEDATFESFEEWGSLAQLSLMVLVEELFDAAGSASAEEAVPVLA